MNTYRQHSYGELALETEAACEKLTETLQLLGDEQGCDLLAAQANLRELRELLSELDHRCELLSQAAEL